ncbi:hypothetical protein [Streptomyces sp. R41]|uniref:Uncharacterized protein n=1 Tax=Streptomyces sp. R41 TaxID=3238632 RepID=A0AB39RS59_9ACTN
MGAVSENATALHQKLADKIVYPLGLMAAPLSDAEITAVGKGRTGRPALREGLVHKLRTVVVTSASDEEIDALAEALDTTPLMFRSNDADGERVIAKTLVLRSQIAAIAAHGGEGEGLSAELLAFINKEVGEARTEATEQRDQSASQQMSIVVTGDDPAFVRRTPQDSGRDVRQGPGQLVEAGVGPVVAPQLRQLVEDDPQPVEPRGVLHGHDQVDRSPLQSQPRAAYVGVRQQVVGDRHQFDPPATRRLDIGDQPLQAERPQDRHLRQ